MEPIVIHFDGSCFRNGRPGASASWGFVAIESATQRTVERQSGPCVSEVHTNNVAELMGLLKSLTWLASLDQLPRGDVTIMGDSKLAIKSAQGRWKVKSPHLVAISRCIATVLSQLRARRNGRFQIHFKWVPRAKNTQAHDAAQPI